MHLGGGVVGQQGLLELGVAGGVAAERVPPGVHDPARVVRGEGEPLRGVPAEGGEPLRAVAAGGDLPQDGVHQTGRPGADDGPGEVDGGVHGRVRGHPQVDELVGARAGAGRAPAGPARPAGGTPAR